MSDFDEMRLLRDADPVKSASIPSAKDAGPRALSERIMMSNPTERRGTRMPLVAAAAAAIVVIATGSIILATRGPAKHPTALKPPAANVNSGSCVAQYSLTTLKQRETAFDGTVVSVTGDEVTFKVNEWFKGGSKNEVTLKGASLFGTTAPGGPITSAGGDFKLDPGARALVAGDGDFAWACGFTQAWNPALASDWRTATH